MNEFKSIQDFVKNLSQDIQQVMETDIKEEAIDLAIQQADTEIYKAYNPIEYDRRYSFLKKELWTFDVLASSVNEHMVAIYNTAKPNPYTNAMGDLFATTDKDLPTLIELGNAKYRKAYGKIGYDFTVFPKAKYLAPRPFISTTSIMLNGNGNKSLKHNIEKSLITKGYRFEK